MLFSSMIFIWVFLPIVLVGNFILTILPFKEKKTSITAKNIFLLISSFIFYAWGGIYYLLIMIASICINFFGGFYIKRKNTRLNERKKLIFVLFLNLSMLFFFKYFNMLIVMIESVMEADKGIRTVVSTMFNMQGTGALGFKKIVLPIGISFFTFQSMSYVIDLYWNKVKLQKNLINFALYVSLFPQLVAGPIVKYSDVQEQISYRENTIELFFSGQKRFCYGLAKKVIISNTFAEVADIIWALDINTMSTGVAWFGAIAYTLQIYYDFSGYSDMAIGIGRMLGFQFKENFNYPYMAKSVQEFWQRWHMSLSTWFKEYVYIPLGGNRKGNFRTCLNVFIVFLLTGIWHGANFTFIFWGVFYAILQIIERCFLKKWLNKNPVKIINWAYTMLMVIIGWVYFRSDNIWQANGIVKQMFSFKSYENTVLNFLSMRIIILLFAAILGFGIIQKLLLKQYKKIEHKLPVMTIDLCFQLTLLVYSIFVIVSGTYNPFIYFQF